ncbi:DEAD/DEAH box helicase family protein [Candidatus Gracilibacteria bacterium]|nr:DEAD/DEAH box helicase family protein [Candidatus Gracilibacteria bacterium]
MSEIRITEQDLVLKVSSSYDIKNFNLNKYEDFLDKLCGTREYQKEAIRKTCIYLLGGQYEHLEDLARQNFLGAIQEKYGKLEKFLAHIHLKDKLSCNIGLATGTGKSFVIYGIAQIMLCEGKIDRVLVLCPSITIRDGLTKKFRSLASDKDLLRLLPQSSKIKNPHIRQADGTIEVGDICIENIHSTYKNTKSAIEDSLINNGHRTLVLNDESHHIFHHPSRENIYLKKWFEFLEDTDYNFRYIVGFTGTPYIENDYFCDVIYKYSILEGIEQKFIKSVDYIKDSEIVLDAAQRMQVIYQNHERFKEQFFKIKPITIFISKDIERCEHDRQKIIELLKKCENISQSEAEKKVLIITSRSDHQTSENLQTFLQVNEKENPVEWICSVAMLTEGWDVPNVFQIVPSEEKAFNSKLLISQVIGRGLRIPEEYKGEELHVKVLNHTKFSANIVHLVDEVLEKEDKIYSYPVPQKSEYCFPIYNLEYSEEQYEIEKEKKGVYSFEKLKKEGITLPSDLSEEDIVITYGQLGNTNDSNEKYHIQKDTIDTEELSQRIFNGIQAWDTEQETSYAEEYDLKTIYDIINKSLKKAGIKVVTKDIAAKCLQAFGTLKRFGNKNVRYVETPKGLLTIDIGSIPKTGMSLSILRKQKGYIFYDEKSLSYSHVEDKEYLLMLEEELGIKYRIKIENSFLFKTPFNLLHTSSTPEKEFIKHLISEENSDKIDAFIKSKDRGLYDFEYTWRKGEHPVTDKFNPDFFIKSGNVILVIEIKGSESERSYSSDFIKNRAKYKQAKKHFETLNKFLNEKGVHFQYFFHFCSPKDYKAFFKYLQNGSIGEYSSRLDVQYETSEETDMAIKNTEYFDNSALVESFGETWGALEENSKVFLTTAEKNYLDNQSSDTYSFSGGELIKAFELELKWKLFDKIRDNETISYEIMEEENSKESKQRNQKIIDFLNYRNDFLDLGSMENALKYNKTLRAYIKNNIVGGDSLISTNSTNGDIIKSKKFDLIPKDFYSDFPNFIGLLRLKYRNESAHGDKTFSKSEFEELKDILISKQGILIQFMKNMTLNGNDLR